MSTRGAFGWRSDGRDLVVFNHFDSYPDGLGNDVLTEIRDMMTQTSLFEFIMKLKDVGIVTPDMNGNYEGIDPIFKNPVNLTEFLQGEVDIIPAWNFLADSLFCEWAYIVNLDSWEFEVYRGFNKDPKALGRYANSYKFSKSEKLDKYWGVRLIGKWSLHGLPTEAELFALDVEEEDEELDIEEEVLYTS